MNGPLLSYFAKTHRLIANFAAYAQGKDVMYWLDILKDYQIDLNCLAEKGAYCLDFYLIPPRDKDVFINTATVSIGEYDFITLGVDQNGRLVNISTWDDGETGLCSLYEDEYFSFSNPDYVPKQSDQQSHRTVDIWFLKQKLDEVKLLIIDLD